MNTNPLLHAIARKLHIVRISFSGFFFVLFCFLSVSLLFTCFSSSVFDYCFVCLLFTSLCLVLIAFLMFWGFGGREGGGALSGNLR